MSGVAGSIPTTSGLKEKEHQKNQDVAKILREDLNERYEERIGRRYAAYKAEQEKLQIEKQGLNTDLQGKINIPDKHRDASSPANSAESRDHSKGRRISKRPKNQGKSDVENTSVTNKSKDLQLEEKIKGYMVSDTHKEMDEKFKRDYIEICEDLNNKEKEQREQEMSSENKIENEEQLNIIIYITVSCSTNSLRILLSFLVFFWSKAWLSIQSLSFSLSNSNCTITMLRVSITSLLNSS